MPAADRGPARSIAFGGIATALCILLLSIVHFSPTADIALFALTSVCIAAVVIEQGMPTGGVVWLSAAAISLVLPGLQTSLAFIGFFGPYPIVKAWIESRPGMRTAVVWALKYLCFNLLLVAGGALVLGPLSGLYGGLEGISSWFGRLGTGTTFLIVAFLFAQVFFVVYDHVLGLLIGFYLRRVRPAVIR